MSKIEFPNFRNSQVCLPDLVTTANTDGSLYPGRAFITKY
jgi:hypothetical protein